MMKIHLILVVILLLLFGNTNAQNNIDLNSLPAVNDLIEVRSNPSADTILLALHGGPTAALGPGDFAPFEVFPNFSVVEVKQYTHLNSVFGATTTFSDAVAGCDTSVAMVKKVVNHFKSLNKVVVIMGHSFGAFLIAEYLDDYGINDFHRVIPMAGRLNMNQDVVDNLLMAKGAGFLNDGLTVVLGATADPNQAGFYNFLAAGAYNRYIDSLQGMDLSVLMYLTATEDVQVGRLLPDEINMLQAHSARVIEIIGFHGAPFDPGPVSQVVAFIRESLPVGNHVVVRAADVKMYPTCVNDQLTISSKKGGLLRIVSITGREVIKEYCNSGNHDVFLSLKSGMYLACFTTDDYETTTQKIIIR